MRRLRELEDRFREASEEFETASVSRVDVVYAIGLAIACTSSYAVVVSILEILPGSHADLLGGLWTIAAVIFVFNGLNGRIHTTALNCLVATLVSIGLCVIYLSIFPYDTTGLIVLIAAGALVLAVLDRRDQMVMTGITTVVVMIVAGMNPERALQEPFLRLLDTLVGIAVGMSVKWVTLRLYLHARITTGSGDGGESPDR